MSTANTTATPTADFVDRRLQEPAPGLVGVERRQFANTYSDLSPEARELGLAIDQFKLANRRRFITAEEILYIVQSLGYRRG